MKVNMLMELEEFNAWAGGAENLKRLIKHSAAYDFINSLIDDMTSENVMDETDINDYLWFGMDDDLREAGFIDEDGDYLPCADFEN